MGSIINPKDVPIAGTDKTLYEIILDQSSDPIFCFDKVGTYLYINQAFSSAFQLMPSDIVGKRIWDVFPGEAGDMRFAAVKKAYDTKEEVVVDVKVPAHDGIRYYITTATPIMDHNNEPVAAICISKEITARKNAELALEKANSLTHQKNLELDDAVKSLYNKSITDSLTNLYNRQHSIDLLEKEIQSQKVRSTGLALMFMDLDDFKAINDTSGHLTGDQVLREFSQSLSNHFLNIGHVGRYGGEEFIVIIPNISSDECYYLAEQFRMDLAASRLSDALVHLTVSIGLSIYNNETLDGFIKAADDLLYIAKNGGRNKVIIKKSQVD